MSRNLYDPTNDTLTPIGGYQSVDPELSTTSENPVQNKVVTSQIQTLTNKANTLENEKADKPLVITLPNVSSSKLAFTSADVSKIANVTADHVVIESVLSNPSAQTGDWTVTTASNSIIISGSISGTTNLTLTLIEA